MTNDSVASFATRTRRVLADDPLITFLKSIANEHVHVFPKSGNAGDGFISYAMYSLFKEFNISFIAHHQGDTVEGKTVVIGGGGNLIEGHYNDVAELIRRHEAKNRVVLLPHTIVGFAEILAKTHENLIVFCREEVSHQLALLNGANPEKTHLSHDLVFFLEDDHFKKYIDGGKGILKALRRDGEASGNIEIPVDSIDISLSWNGDIWTSPQFCAHVTESLAAFIAPYETVQTDRLHISILSAFLGKNVFMMPNSYFKNRAVFEHSIRARFPGVVFVNTMPTVNEPPRASAPVPSPVEPKIPEVVIPNAPDGNIEALQAQNHELRAQLANAQGTLTQRTAQADLLSKEVASLNQKVSHLDELAERSVQMRERAERSFELRQQMLRDRISELVRKHEQVRQAEANLHETTRLQQLRDEIEGLHREINRLHQEIQGAHQEIERAHQEIRHSHHEANELRQRADGLYHDLDSVLNSTSWRISGPFRALLIRSRTALRWSR